MKICVLVLALTLGLASAAAAAPKPEGTVDMADVLKPGPLPELSSGPETGVPVVEYGSVTCPHCAAFDREPCGRSSRRLMSTPARFATSSANSRAIRSTSPPSRWRVASATTRAMATIELLFATQDKWAFVENPLEPLLDRAAADRPRRATRRWLA